jgi:hypothetical protein
MPKRVVGGRFYRGTNSSVRCKDSSSESMSKLILKSMIFVRILERGWNRFDYDSKIESRAKFGMTSAHTQVHDSCSLWRCGQHEPDAGEHVEGAEPRIGWRGEKIGLGCGRRIWGERENSLRPIIIFKTRFYFTNPFPFPKMVWIQSKFWISNDSIHKNKTNSTHQYKRNYAMTWMQQTWIFIS